MKDVRPACNECRNTRHLTWLGMCVSCTLAEVERRLRVKERS